MLNAQLIKNVSSDIVPTLRTCKNVLAKHYGQKLQGVILFGSAVRNEMTKESDLDLLVLLPQPMDHVQELRTVVDLIYPVQLEASYWISVMPAAQDEFSAGSIQLYRNIKREGLFL